ncbi:hypothetical protein HYV87_03605 [Candidatus Woesearchaeota archaeon]|nr:hypothetical protein [Candidatus Woesearchaeota archaeon]
MKTAMRLPTEQQCLNYFTEYKVPDNILKHCCKVREVAVFLAERLKERNFPIDIEFVSCLAYFHDLCKMIVITDFGKNKFHQEAVITPEQAEFWKKMQQKFPQHYEGEVAYELFKEIYPELASSLKKVSSSKNDTPTWEEMVVHYADLRVLGERVVTVRERVAYLRQRYQHSQEIWQKHQQMAQEQEQKIFSHLAFTPDDLGMEISRKFENKNMIKAIYQEQQ